ncbi:MAG: type IX secretion system membrane protein PorP/SprF [Crocinitomicaceae bacterium]|nr:MAG: type IX secretion system membrane protein PorP/SprF [Crocinitomicaceae bacterium]
MSNPSFSNIDRWLFELMEGNLSPEQIAQLEAFMLQHPELDVDKDVWAQAKLDQQEYVYPHQDKFVRRRPVGLYSAIGFFTIVLLTSLAIYTNTNSDFTKDLAIVRNQEKFENEKIAISKSVNSTKAKFTNRLNASIRKMDEQTNDLKPRLTHDRYFDNTTNSIASVAGKHENKALKTVVSVEEMSGTSLAIVESEKSIASVSKLDALKADLIDVQESDFVDANESKRAVRFAKSDYKVTFGSRLHKIGRNLQRMLDNPIALRNQRDPYYHVPGMQAMDVNFSSVGTMLATRVQATGRAQWLGSDNQQIMSQLSIDGYSYAMRGGLGFQMSHNYYGLGQIENYNASLTYSPKFSVSRGVTVEPSVRFKMGSKMLDSKNLLPGTKVEYDRSAVQEFLVNGSAPIGRQLWYKDLGLGLMVNTKWFYAGIQGDDLFNHYDNIYSNALDDQRRVGSHFVATLGTDYESMKKTITVSPYIVYQQRETLKEAWLGTTVKLKWLTVGGAISSNLEPAASIGLKFQQFAITYNADYTQSALLNQRSLSHQMTIRFVSKPSRIGQRLLN